MSHTLKELNLQTLEIQKIFDGNLDFLIEQKYVNAHEVINDNVRWLPAFSSPIRITLEKGSASWICIPVKITAKGIEHFEKNVDLKSLKKLKKLKNEQLAETVKQIEGRNEDKKRATKLITEFLLKNPLLIPNVATVVLHNLW